MRFGGLVDVGADVKCVVAEVGFEVLGVGEEGGQGGVEGASGGREGDGVPLASGALTGRGGVVRVDAGWVV